MGSAEQRAAAAELNAAFGLNPFQLMILQYVMLALVTASLLLRLYVRIFMLKALGADDYLLILSWVR